MYTIDIEGRTYIRLDKQMTPVCRTLLFDPIKLINDRCYDLYSETTDYEDNDCLLPLDKLNDYILDAETDNSKKEIIL